MSWIERPPLNSVFRRRENDGEPVNDRRLAAQIAAGAIVRIAPGAFADRSAWNALRPIDQHAQRVWEASVRIGPGRVISHFSAAALHGIDILGAWPDRLDISADAGRGGRSSGLITRHAADLSSIETIPWGLHHVTTPLRTAVDLIASVRFVEGVSIADQVLWSRRDGGPLVVANELRACADLRVGRGSARARAAAAFSTDLADSVRESQSRVLIFVMGFPPPELQARFILSDGSAAYTDFFWREYRHIGEYDGVGKYRDPGLLRGRSGHEALIAEKDREDDLRRQVDAFSRWRTPALTSPRLLYNILAAAGLPTDLSRPGR
ncbi:hypothetical protein QL996_03555 [Planococcus sp. APC 4015]|nr:hypothetical protein [Planococcus sp. APC 4015]